MKRGVFSVQYAENSTSDWVDRMKAGAVREDRVAIEGGDRLRRSVSVYRVR